ncbi:histone-lysine N-methyltransferase SETMAR [Trichonephila clavipes]|nr:histone-lysine N-methyltransferase SETMAR [Trichonephila clavipes]
MRSPWSHWDSSPSPTTVKCWAAELKRGRKSLRGDERSGRPNTGTTNGNITKVHQMVLDDHRIKVREVAEVMNMSKERVCHILDQHLGMGKLFARWVLHFLTKTVTEAYYTSLLDKLKVELAEKRLHLQKKKILFHQDNALSHIPGLTMAKIHELWFKLLDHPPYSPDLAPSDFSLFPHLKTALGGQRFSANEEAFTFVNNYFAEKNADYYFDWLQR